MDTLAMLYSSAGNHQKALALQRKVVELRPDVPVFKLNLAHMLIKAGDRDAARTILDQLKGMGDKFSGQGEVQRLLKESQ
jgi:predicted Zn-dependent protease